MRPKYETEESLQDERRLISFIEPLWRCKGAKTPGYYALDYALHRSSEVLAFAEFKCRKNTFDKYPTYILSLHKFMAAEAVSKSMRIPSFIVVEWTDRIGFVTVTSDVVVRLTMGGRKDRGDPQDMEPVVEIDLKKFKILVSD